MSNLIERAEAARVKAVKKNRADAEKKNRATISETKPILAERIGKVVGRRVAQSRLENLRIDGTDKHGSAVVVCTYEDVEFGYSKHDGFLVRRACPDCGATITTRIYGEGENALAQLATFLKRTAFDSYVHTCYEQAVKSLRREAESHARHVTASPEYLLEAASSYVPLRRF
jgi:hypothetical protein